MKVRVIAVMFSLMAFAHNGHAQRAGFAVGIAPTHPPMVIQAPVTGFVTSPVTGFVTSPVTGFGIVPTINSGFISTSPYNAGYSTGFGRVQTSHQTFSNRGGTVVVPGGIGTVIAPGATVIASGGGVIVPYVIVGPGSVVQGPVIVAGPHFNGQPHGNGRHNRLNNSRPPGRPTVIVGDSRAHVLQQFGNPSVTVRTRDGETLHYSNGMTVVLQNGQVIQTR